MHTSPRRDSAVLWGLAIASFIVTFVATWKFRELVTNDPRFVLVGYVSLAYSGLFSLVVAAVVRQLTRDLVSFVVAAGSSAAAVAISFATDAERSLATFNPVGAADAAGYVFAGTFVHTLTTALFLPLVVALFLAVPPSIQRRIRTRVGIPGRVYVPARRRRRRDSS